MPHCLGLDGSAPCPTHALHRVTAAIHISKTPKWAPNPALISVTEGWSWNREFWRINQFSH